MSEFYDLIRSRKSVRTYDGRNFTKEDRGKLETYAKTVNKQPFRIRALHCRMIPSILRRSKSKI